MRFGSSPLDLHFLVFLNHSSFWNSLPDSLLLLVISPKTLSIFWKTTECNNCFDLFCCSYTIFFDNMEMWLLAMTLRSYSSRRFLLVRRNGGIKATDLCTPSFSIKNHYSFFSNYSLLHLVFALTVISPIFKADNSIPTTFAFTRVNENIFMFEKWRMILNIRV